jgi:hypothetical protein
MQSQQAAAGRLFCRCVFIFLGVIISLTIRYPGIDTDVWANETKLGDNVTIVTPGTEARLCPQPGCGPDQHIVRIPEGTVLTIEGTDIFEIGSFKVKWFEVIYQNHRGWISIYDTDIAKKIKKIR